MSISFLDHMIHHMKSSPRDLCIHLWIFSVRFRSSQGRGPREQYVPNLAGNRYPHPPTLHMTPVATGIFPSKGSKKIREEVTHFKILTPGYDKNHQVGVNFVSEDV